MVFPPRTRSTLLLLGATLLSFLSRAFSQQLHDEQPERRRATLEQILRLQDLRTPHDGKLIELLGDGDSVVRERATLAYGSIQDTTVLALLQRNLTEGPASLQEAAAFAIGQTGTQLGEAGRESLEHELIWKRLPATAVPDRLIEETGKFGTVEGLNDLMINVGNVQPLQFTHGLTMCIARFAIRGIVTDAAVRYLLQFLRPPDQTPWEVVYALQRIGAHPFVRGEIDQITLLARHPDPLVRMNLVILLGKLRDEPASFESLARIAEFDPDWRVKVNALRSFSLLPVRANARALEIFRRAFYDQNEHVSLTALATFSSSGIGPSDTSETARECLEELRAIAENRSHDLPWQQQAAAALTYARLVGPAALPSVMPGSWPEPRLRAQLIQAVGATGDSSAGGILLAETGDDEPLIACAALDALRALAQRRAGDGPYMAKAYAAFISALARENVSVVTTAASALTDSLFQLPSSVQPLLDALASKRVPDDIETMQEIIATLGDLHDRRAVSPLMLQLRSDDRSVALAAAKALNAITGQDYRGSLKQWYQPILTDFDFTYLRTLPPVLRVRLETSQGDIELELERDIAPFTIMSMMKLATQRGFYRGLSFHRVVANFVVQGGDPRGDGWGGPGYTVRSEFSPREYGTGTVGIASAGKDTEGSQFFITHSPQPHLDGRYTVIGRVVSGMEIVDRLQVGDRLYDFVPLGSDALRPR